MKTLHRLPLLLPLLLWSIVTSMVATAQTTEQCPLADSLAQVVTQRLDSIIAANPVLIERTQLGLYVYDLTADSALYAHGHHQLLRPASTQKILTAVTALSALGGDYRLRTTLSTTGNLTTDTTRTRQGSLVVRGGMDPCYGTEEVRTMSRAVRELGLDTIEGDLILDLSLKDTTRLGWGWCWDDKAIPLRPLLCQGRDNFAQEFLSALRREGVVLTGRVREAYTTTQLDQMTLGTQPLRQLAESRTSIDRVLERMLKRSDNHYAESIFYQLGRSSKQAAQRVSSLLSSIGLDTKLLQVADGSGLSLYNYTTPEALVLILRHAYRTPAIYQHLQPALPLAGYDGTLSHRMTSGAAHHHVMAKTGTLTGVSTLAGYAVAPNGHMLAFAIMNQGLRHTSSGHHFQDAVCQALCTPYAQPIVIVPDDDTAHKDALQQQDPSPLQAEPDDAPSDVAPVEE
ncbi:MAG: D-alanyl-D-alanine carboxypeptidase/D-alanyl-D-alanine-endopeptidase [Bacteroidaceae bacterium]|nr:D-alanyl-D-alanine carboxypeptidase/D-alanyl-D-alanine-endopeptidase [Bacteroidaceae bacterium]